MILDLMLGGELDYHLQARKKGEGWKEEELRFYAMQVLCTLAYLHNDGKSQHFLLVIYLLRGSRIRVGALELTLVLFSPSFLLFIWAMDSSHYTPRYEAYGISISFSLEVFFF